MKPFRIIITGASRPDLWYAKRIGETFEAYSAGESEIFSDSYFRVTEHGYVYWADCELAPQPEAAGHKLIRTSLELMPGDPHSLDYYAKLISGVRSELGRTFDENERQAAELALLRRVAEAADKLSGQAVSIDFVSIAEGEKTEAEFYNALAAWKAGAK